MKVYQILTSRGEKRLSGGTWTGKRGKIWTGLSYVKNHFHSRFPGLLRTTWLKDEGKYDKSYAPEIVASLDDTIVEYELVEVRRFPASELFQGRPK